MHDNTIVEPKVVEVLEGKDDHRSKQQAGSIEARIKINPGIQSSE